MKNAKRVELLRQRRQDLESLCGSLATRLLRDLYLEELDRTDADDAPARDEADIAARAITAGALANALEVLRTLRDEDADEFLESTVRAIDTALIGMFDDAEICPTSIVGRVFAAARAYASVLGYRGAWQANTLLGPARLLGSIEDDNLSPQD